MHQPQVAHMNAALRIVRYLKGIAGHGVLFRSNRHLNIQMYTDVDWAGDKGNKRSTSGYFSLVGGNLVTWRSKKQKVVSLSSTEAEFRAAIQISENPVQHDRTKHVEVDRHFIKEKLEAGIIELPFVKSSDQLADILTKAVGTDMFHKCLSKLNFGNPTIQLEEEALKNLVKNSTDFEILTNVWWALLYIMEGIKAEYKAVAEYDLVLDFMKLARRDHPQSLVYVVLHALRNLMLCDTNDLDEISNSPFRTEMQAVIEDKIIHTLVKLLGLRGGFGVKIKAILALKFVAMQMTWKGLKFPSKSLPTDPSNTQDGSKAWEILINSLHSLVKNTQEDVKLQVLLESKDLSSLALDELIGNLKVHEVVMKDSEIYRGKKKRVKSIALKANKEYSDGETLTSESDDEEYVMAVKNFKKFFKRKDVVIQIISLAIVQNHLATKIKRPSLEVHGAIAKMTPKTKLTMKLVSWLNRQMRKSTSGVYTFMGCCLTSWFAKKQTALPISTTEAEYVSARKACQQALWMKQVLIDYGIRLDEVSIMCDNKGAIDISKNPVQHSRTKDIEICHHFIRNNIQKDNISIEKVASEDNIADIFTKPLKRKVFNYLRLGLGMMELFIDSDSPSSQK
nr:uncharacterized mitochondrial protein AtMg00810-like [Tanacetum cinerariifolium]